MASDEIVESGDEFDLGEVAGETENNESEAVHGLEFNIQKWEDGGMNGFAPALGIVGYVALFTVFIMSANKVIPGPDPAWAPLVFLTLLCFSVLTCGLIVFYKPYTLFIDKKGKEAGDLVLATTKWLGILAVVILSVMVAVSRG